MIVFIITFLLTRHQDPAAWRNLKTAFLSTALTLGGFAIWHLLRTPWLAHQVAIGKEAPKEQWIFGVLGITVMAGILVGGIVLASWAGNLHITHVVVSIPGPPPPQIITPLPPRQPIPKLQVEDRRGAINGRVFYQDEAGNLNLPDPLYIRNIGPIPIQQIAVHVYFSEVVALTVRPTWESTGTGYDDFPFELWVRDYISLSPKEKWTVPTLQGKRANIEWTKPIIVKMEVFCGNPKPEKVIFYVEKK